MVQAYMHDFEQFLHDTAEKHTKSGLISWTERLDSADALAFFHNAANLTGERNIWVSTSNDFWLVGAGAAAYVNEQQNDQLNSQKQLDHVLESAIVHNLFAVPGTGPIVFSGMAFDNKHESGSKWTAFPASQNRIPRFTLTKSSGHYYFTVNVWLKQQTVVSELIEQLREERKMLFQSSEMAKSKAQLISKKEIMPEQWKQTVKFATDQIISGYADKIVLAREMELTYNRTLSVTRVVKNLIDQQKDSFVFAVENGGSCFIGASPERLVEVREGNLNTSCLAGTAPRGKDQAEDEAIGQMLLEDQKNREEHAFVVSMITETIQKYGQVTSTLNQPELLKLKNLQHLHTPITAVLSAGTTIAELVAELHPTPALGGLPSEAAVSFIREHEGIDRGWYGAPVGWMDQKQNGEFAVAIRSGLMTDKLVTLFAGCGVVRDSDPESEFEETAIKFTPMLEALEGKE